MVAALGAAGATEQELEERIVEVDLELYDSTAMDVAGIGVRAFRLKHSEYVIEAISQRLELTFPNRVIFETPLQARYF
jgi:hypothetical protein